MEEKQENIKKKKEPEKGEINVYFMQLVIPSGQTTKSIGKHLLGNDEWAFTHMIYRKEWTDGRRNTGEFMNVH